MRGSGSSRISYCKLQLPLINKREFGISFFIYFFNHKKSAFISVKINKIVFKKLNDADLRRLALIKY